MSLPLHVLRSTMLCTAVGSEKSLKDSRLYAGARKS